jgi:hypothetical protein
VKGLNELFPLSDEKSGRNCSETLECCFFYCKNTI